MNRQWLNPAQEGDGSEDREKPLLMQRGVSQLLFNYLPQRTVDWEDGLAVVGLSAVRLSGAWQEDRKVSLLKEIGDLFDRWRAKGGTVDREFPDPRREPERFTIGLPDSINAYVFPAPFICQSCGQLVFSEKK